MFPAVSSAAVAAAAAAELRRHARRRRHSCSVATVAANVASCAWLDGIAYVEQKSTAAQDVGRGSWIRCFKVCAMISLKRIPMRVRASQSSRLAASQGLTLVHVRAQLEQLQATFMSSVGLSGGQQSSS